MVVGYRYFRNPYISTSNLEPVSLGNLPCISAVIFPCLERPLTLISHLLGRTGKSLRDGRNPQLIFLSKIATGALGNPSFKAENEATVTVGSGEKHCNITRVERSHQVSRMGGPQGTIRSQPK